MGSVLISLLAAADGGVALTCAPARCEVLPSARIAVERVLAAEPLVVAVGEYHEREGGPKVKSALKRFTEELLPSLAGRGGALVVETWILSGRCGQVERKVEKEVQKTTQRPKTTEDELGVMMGRAYDLGLKNHTLVVSCAEYQPLLDEKGELDPEQSLLLVRRKVTERALKSLDDGEAGPDAGVLLLYGGALHNDLVPLPGMADYSFGPRLSRETGGRFAELDLLVPEYVEADEDLLKEPWFPQVMKLAKAGKTVLITPSPQVYLLLFPRTSAR